MKITKKNLVLLFIVVVIAVPIVSAQVYQYTRKEEDVDKRVLASFPAEKIVRENADWKRYKDTALGVEIGYPKNWIVTTEQAEVIHDEHPSFLIHNEQGAVLEIKKEDVSESKPGESQPYVISSVLESPVNGIAPVIVFEMVSDQSVHKRIYVPSRKVSIYMSYPKGQEGAVLPVFDRMLASLVM